MTSEDARDARRVPDAAAPRHDFVPGVGALLQRTILPSPGEADHVRAMYFTPDGDASEVQVLGRHSVQLQGPGKVSFGTYFNAFPASYWRHWTSVTEVRLKLTVNGRGRIDIYGSDASAQREHVQTIECSSDSPIDVSATLDLAPFDEGGWYWFDVNVAGEGQIAIHAAGWYVLAEPAVGAAVVLGIPTMNRPEMCLRILETVADDPDLLATVAAVVVVDQGDDRLSGRSELAAVGCRLGGRLKLVEQTNLGGSGGFARVMHEALGTTADHFVLLDDDVVVEPESVHRAIAFARFTRQPTLVGAQMLSLTERSRLHSMGEVVDQRTFGWRKAPGTEYGHDLGRTPLLATEWLHRRIDVDYNGWWMCLVPRKTVETVGLPLPLFLKWDDAEYGLRANRHGHPTVTMPGVAVWHMPWSDREQLAGWQTYFYVRNRLITTALHGPAELPAELVRSSLRRTIRSLLAMEYSTVAMRLLAIGDFLDGPESLFSGLAQVLPRVTACRNRYPDGRMLPRSDVPPPAGRVRSPRRPPAGMLTTSLRYAYAFLHNARRPVPRHHVVPQAHMAADEAGWYRVAGLDGVSVSARGGSQVAFRKRDRRAFWFLLATGLRLHLALARRFGDARSRYHRHQPALVSRVEWIRRFS